MHVTSVDHFESPTRRGWISSKGIEKDFDLPWLKMLEEEEFTCLPMFGRLFSSHVDVDVEA